MTVTLSKENAELAKNLNMQMTSHFNMENCGILQHNGEYQTIKFGRVIETPKRNGQWGKGKASFFFEGEKKNYKDINEFLDEFRKRLLTVTK